MEFPEIAVLAERDNLGPVLGDSPFARFMQFSDWVYATMQKTHQFPLHKLFDLVYTGLTTLLEVQKEVARTALEQDFIRSGSKEKPSFMK